MILIVYAGTARKVALITGRRELCRLGKDSRLYFFHKSNCANCLLVNCLTFFIGHSIESY